MTAAADLPTVSVVTVSFNAARTIRRTIDSVLAQTHPILEYLVIDGGSTDGTLDILRSYGDRLRFVSEPDRGMYEAMNKGVTRSRGQWIHLLNADDWYVADDALARAVPHLDPNRTTYFDLFRAYPDGRRILQSRDVRPYMLYISAFLPHPSLIVARSQYDAVGLYDPELRIASDHDLILRLVRKFPPRHVRLPLTVMDQTGISARSLDTSLNEFSIVTRRHGLPAALVEAIRVLKVAWWKTRSHG